MNSGQQSDERVIRNYFNFRLKSPIAYFKDVFKKEVDQQWLIARAMLLNLVLQAANLGCLQLTQSTLTIRMEFEENEQKRALWGLIFHLLAWAFLCYLRRRQFTIPPLIGMMTFNVFALTYLYTQSYSMTANTLGDPNSKIIYACFALSDAFFSFAYVSLSDYIYPWGHFGFCLFPKIFFAVSLYFFFDDRGTQIVSFFLLTSGLAFLQGVVGEELLVDCHHEAISEFGLLDYFTLLYLDAPYLARKCVLSLSDMFFSRKIVEDTVSVVDASKKKED